MSAAELPEAASLSRARARLAGVAYRTPLERSGWLSERAGCDVYLKLECWQRTRSFKIRGAYNALAELGSEGRVRGVVAASAGNHGQGVAYAARVLGARAVVFVPASAPQAKLARIRALGAELRVVDGPYDAAEAAAREEARATGAAFVHPCSDPAVVAGQGTVGLEIAEELPSVREAVVPVGGGGLLAGVGVALRRAAPHIRVIGVQSERTRGMHEAFRAARPVPVPDLPTLADGLAGGVDEAGYRRARAVAAELVLVPEAAIEAAIRDLFRYDGVVAEGAGAVAAAAVAQGRVELRGPAALVISGGNLDGARLATILAGS